MLAAARHDSISNLTRPPRALVVWEPSPEEIGAEVDWSLWYLTDEEDMGEGGEQGLLINVLKSVLEVLSSERGWQQVYIGSDQFFAWRRAHPLVRVSPDVYLYDDPPPRPLPASWQTWIPGHHAPRLAVEIVSGETWRKDYEDNPPKYAQLGTIELVIFDPEAATASSRIHNRVPLQVFRRDADDVFVRVFAGDGPAASEQLDAWLVVVHEDNAVTLRVARDACGKDLVPTQAAARIAVERESKLPQAKSDQAGAWRAQEFV